MLTKRIIPCLDIRDGRVVKGVNFVDIRDAGDPGEAAVRYNEAGADELVLLDINASYEKRGTMLDVVSRVAEQVFIPFTVGGGISDIDQIRALLRLGADKVSINSPAVRNPDFITESALRFGSQCIGGAGKMEHFRDALTVGHADAALAATLFHFGILKISDLKEYLAREGVPVRRT